jgi:hypothetical protein
MVFEIGKYTLDIDVDKTREFYIRAQKITEGCDCQGCRNYAKWAETLSVEPKYTLEQWGVFNENSEIALVENFKIVFTNNVDLLEEGFPTPVIQMEISSDIPFLLEEECDY